ncbi:MAG: hypothetical protein IJW28_02740 [Clostridia bacterium]|nr:hypothetical protein [Clostridia bacterium]
MSEFYKVILIVIISSLVIVLLRQTKPEFSVLITVVVSIFIITIVIDKLSYVFQFFNKIILATNIGSDIILIIIKTIVIAYISDFAINLCTDMGVSSMASKISVFSKILILLESMPLVYSLFQVVLELIV